MIDGLRAASVWGDRSPTTEELSEQFPSFKAMQMNTISSTSLGGGFKHNVIPAFAEATLDCRLLPGESHDGFLAEMRSIVDDPNVELEVVLRSESGFSDFETGLVSVIKDVVTDQVEGALVLPVTGVGFTDSRVLRRHGVQAYGFVPTLMDASLSSGVHGHNERVPVESLRTGIQILFETVRRFTAQPV